MASISFVRRARAVLVLALAAGAIRRHLMTMQPPQALKTLTENLAKTKSNQDLFNSMRM